MKPQDPLCHLRNCHAGTSADLIITRTEQSSIELMQPIVIPTSISLTQIQMFCHFLKGILRIASLISIGHFSPKLSIFGEIDAVSRMNLRDSHEVCLRNKCNVSGILEDHKGSCASC